MKPIFWVCILLVLFTSSPSRAAKVDCNDSESWQKAARGHSIEECQKSIQKFETNCEEGTLESTSGSVNRTLAENYCLQALLNVELDKRLLPLKKQNPTKFQSEMSLQKNFNLARDKICDELNSCDGTMYRQTRAACILSLTKWRLDQATEINLGKLKLSKVESIRSKLTANKELRSFSDSLCSIQSEIFATKSSGTTCVKSLQNSFLAAAGPACDSE